MAEKSYCQRKFGKSTIRITREGKISIIDDWYSNYGLIYPFQIKDFKRGIESPTMPGTRLQVIGMDSEVCKTHREWIYSKIDKGYFDHLI